jgi:hypothetical protein
MRILSRYDGTRQHRVDLPTRSFKVMVWSIAVSLTDDPAGSRRGRQPSNGSLPMYAKGSQSIGPTNDVDRSRELCRSFGLPRAPWTFDAKL